VELKGELVFLPHQEAVSRRLLTYFHPPIPNLNEENVMRMGFQYRRIILNVSSYCSREEIYPPANGE
jgi:hypothetical protein